MGCSRAGVSKRSVKPSDQKKFVIVFWPECASKAVARKCAPKEGFSEGIDVFLADHRAPLHTQFARGSAATVRNEDDKIATGTKQSAEISKCRAQIAHVFKNVGAVKQVEAVSWKIAGAVYHREAKSLLPEHRTGLRYFKSDCIISSVLKLPDTVSPRCTIIEQSPSRGDFAHGGDPATIIQKTAAESACDKARQITARRKIGYRVFAVGRLVKPPIFDGGKLWPKKHQLAMGTMAQLRDEPLPRQQSSVHVSAIGTMLVLSHGDLAETVKRESSARHDPPFL